MRVWQPGGHLTQRRDAPEIEDWSWTRTARRISTLAALTKPYRLRTTLAIVSLLAAEPAFRVREQSLDLPVLAGDAGERHA